MPDPTVVGVRAHGHGVPQNDDKYYSDEADEDDYEDDDDDDDDVVLARYEENKENMQSYETLEKRTKGTIALKQKVNDDEDEDVPSAADSEDRGSVGSHHVLQQQRQQKQQEKPVKSGGLCSGRSSTEVKNTQKSVDQKKQQNTDTPPALSEVPKSAQKRSGGLCRGSKNVEVEDSLKPAAPSNDHKDQGQEEKGQKGQESPGDVTKAAESKQISGKTNGDTKKSGGLCGGKESVQVEESLSPKETQEKGVKPDTNQQPSTGADIQKGRNATENAPSTSKKSGGLCGGKSSVEVKDSLSPAGKPETENGEKGTQASSVKGNKQRQQKIGDGDGESDISKGKVTKKKKKAKKSVEVEKDDEEKTMDSFDEERSRTEIYVGPEPPPPTLKKVKKKKKKARMIWEREKNVFFQTRSKVRTSLLPLSLEKKPN